MNDLYKTLAAQSEGIYKEKGSRFLAFAYPINSVDEAMQIVAELKKKYHDAHHHCYAYRLGLNGEDFRANDDGEPSGTAGRPIHGQLLSFEVTNVLVVVVRYFGGIKLGTSGLIVAYKSATSDVLSAAEIVERHEEIGLRVTCNYEQLTYVLKQIAATEARIVSQNYDMTCSIDLYVPKSQAEMIKKIGGVEEL
ncbi:MAG: YigZ family protein [Bacteroidales bacterium]|nr:YigZ family protein [Bacteroidales bacterium]